MGKRNTIYFVLDASEKRSELFLHSHDREDTLRYSLDRSKFIVKYSPKDLRKENEAVSRGKVFRVRDGMTYEQIHKYMKEHIKEWEEEVTLK